jgi:hypothetical protein
MEGRVLRSAGSAQCCASSGGPKGTNAAVFGRKRDERVGIAIAAPHQALQSATTSVASTGAGDAIRVETARCQRHLEVSWFLPSRNVRVHT